LGANEKIVRRLLRHAKPHGAKDRYIKAVDPAVLEANAAHADGGGWPGAATASSRINGHVVNY